MHIFDEINIETQSTCNRRCPTCMRQTWPDKTALAGRFETHQMPADLVRSLLDQAAEMGFRGRVCLQHYNEPMQDERIADFGRYAMSKGQFLEVYINTNGDYINEAMAERLDGAFDRLHIALYDGHKVQRSAQYRSLFKQTSLTFTGGEHVITHFSPHADLAQTIAAVGGQPCERESQMRCIIAYTGEMLMCCDDIAGAFALGNAHETPLNELWFGERHRQILETLAQPGGRQQYSLCQSCPRINTPHWSTRQVSL